MRALILAFVTLAACQPGVGEINVTAWGEERATEGFAAADFADGWRVQFATVGVHIDGIEARDQDKEALVGEAGASYLVDLAAESNAVALTTFEAPAKRVWFGFSTRPAAAAAERGSISDAVATRMVDEGLSRLVRGTATRDAESVSFDLAFTDAYNASYCNNGRDGTPGLAVSDVVGIEAELTLHLDHLFWNAVGTEEADLRFQPWADAAVNGHVTLAELAAIDTASIGYETAGLNLPDLAAFVGFSFASATHLNGLGLCTIRSL